jgi:hypothetical protein
MHMIYKIGFVGPNASEEAQGLFATFPSGVHCGIQEENVKQVDPVSGEVREETGYVVKFDNLALMNSPEKGVRYAVSVRTLATLKAIAEAIPALAQVFEPTGSQDKVRLN